jgi:signal transduction histidine kinase
VRLSAEVDDPMPPAPVDANAVHQVLLNLLANAVDAAPAGSGRVTVRCRLDGAAGRFVVEVDDDGPGIPAEQRPRLFEAFASTKGQRGTGLGLAVARSLVTRHGGDVEHEDLRPRGTRMRAWFPADRGDPDAERTRAPRPGEPPAVRWDPPER